MYLLAVAFVPEADQQHSYLPPKVNDPFNSCCHRQAVALSKEVVMGVGNIPNSNNCLHLRLMVCICCCVKLMFYCRCSA